MTNTACIIIFNTVSIWAGEVECKMVQIRVAFFRLKMAQTAIYLPAEEFWLQGGQVIICVFSSASTFDLLQCYLCVSLNCRTLKGFIKDKIFCGGSSALRVGMLNTSMGSGSMPHPPSPPPNKIIITLCACSPSISITHLLRSESVWGESPLDDPVGRLP